MSSYVPEDGSSQPALSADDAAAPDQDTSGRGWSCLSSVTKLRQPQQAGGAGRWFLFAGAAALIVATVLTLGFQTDSQLRFEVRGASAQGGVIDARRGEATVALSDGSTILAENGTRFQVEILGRNSALTRLLSGKLHVAVVPNEDTSYRFVAGPYEVRVVGTELDLAWSEQSGLGVTVSKGSVRLLEPGGGQVRVLGAGSTVSLPSRAPPHAGE